MGRRDESEQVENMERGRSSANDDGSDTLDAAPMNQVVANGEDSYLVRSELPCLGGHMIHILSEWQIDVQRRCVILIRAHMEIQGIRVDLERTLTPQSHLDLLAEYLQGEGGLSVHECEQDISTLANRETVFLAQGSKFAEVFLDRLSAVHWARSPDAVREVSVEAARCALKTDRETVLSSALSATEREHDLIKTLQRFHRVAKDSFDLIEQSRLTIPESVDVGDSADE